MKTKIRALFLLVVVITLSSCGGMPATRIPIPALGGSLVIGGGGQQQQRYGQPYGGQPRYQQYSGQQPQQQVSQVDGYNLSKTRARLFDANISGVPRSVPETKANEVRKALAVYADQVWDSKKHELTADEASEFASKQLGQTVRAEVRMKTLTGSERVIVHTERVELSDVPAHIRAKFENQR